ncbi:hypothetical protein [Xanthomonas hortorum]|uniref:Uncharacterized protein n=1 Tax=Xanthomonas hortorum TaxID=56454 RepID=A0AA47IC06_9XANT|nr:hypothetical protein [Xanthomonas hortorum]WAH63903.1 hypothetical protein OEG85_21155 [Xanthomonas hortorum]
MKLTNALNKKITKDWHAALEGFEVASSMNLARRVGPFIQGICLDRDSSNVTYLPTLYVHCLCRPFPVVSLSLGQPLLNLRSGTVERLKVQFHEDSYQDAINRTLGSSLLPTKGDWRLPQLVEAYERYRGMNRPDSRFPVHLWEDVVSAHAWAGAQVRASVLADKYTEVAEGWPKNVLEREGGIILWRERLKDLAISGDVHKVTVANEIDKLGLESLPVSNLIP